jgi:hypothetical protein
MNLRDGRQERRASRQGREQTIEPEPERDPLEVPGAAIVEGVVVPERQWRAAGRQRRLAWAWIGFALAARALRDPRFDAALITGAIALVALSQMGKEGFARNMERLIAWDELTSAEAKSERWLRAHVPDNL